MNKYCIHVVPRDYEYDDIEAKTPEEAKEKVVHTYFANNSDDIADIETYLQCPECNYDNNPKGKECEDCGAKLQ